MRLSSWMRSVKARFKYSVLLGNGSSGSGSNLRQSRSLRKRQRSDYTSLLGIERLESRITPSAPPTAIFYFDPKANKHIFIPNNDINTAFSDILIGTGRSHVLNYQVRRGGGEDKTAGSGRESPPSPPTDPDVPD
jgi:hypothetical protein